MSEKVDIGGQAVLEGVMMRSPGGFSVAVRRGGRSTASIAVLCQAIPPLGKRFPLLKKKFLRGSAALFEAMWLGIRALNFSANEAIESDDEKQDEIGPLALAGAVIAAFAVALGLFLALPLLLTNLLGSRFASLGGSSLLFNLTDGAFRVVLFLGYLSGISLLNDIRRVFEYHGAEHKTIAAYEAGVALTVENARGYSRIHPRCGTSFLLIVVVLSIVVFSLIPVAWPLWAKGVARIALLPVIAGAGYEFLKYSAKRRDSRLIGSAILPGLWLQRLTTREPSDDQLEVAIRAMQEALAMEPR